MRRAGPLWVAVAATSIVTGGCSKGEDTNARVSEQPVGRTGGLGTGGAGADLRTDGDFVKINQWAADTYPVEQKHLDTARALENAAKKLPAR